MGEMWLVRGVGVIMMVAMFLSGIRNPTLAWGVGCLGWCAFSLIFSLYYCEVNKKPEE